MFAGLYGGEAAKLFQLADASDDFVAITLPIHLLQLMTGHCRANVHRKPRENRVPLNVP